MEQFGEILMQLPSNLKHLELTLFGNKLGDKSDNIKWIGEAMKWLPNNLEYFKLYLYDNNLG